MGPELAFERYREFIRRLSPTVLSTGWGEKLQGTIAGLVWDAIMDGVTSATKSPWLSLLTEQPADALPVVADERKLPKYVVESVTQWQARLLGAWDIWEAGGAQAEILTQLLAAGYDAEIHSPIDWPSRSPLGWYSQFWVFLKTPGPFGGPSLAGAAVEGQHLCGISGPVERVEEVRRIVHDMRPGHVVCRSVIVLVSGTLCGSGAIEGAHFCGGVSAQIGTGLPPTGLPIL